MFGCMGIVPQKYECKDCGWSSQINIKVTNRPLTVRDVEVDRRSPLMQKKNSLLIRGIARGTSMTKP